MTTLPPRPRRLLSLGLVGALAAGLFALLPAAGATAAPPAATTAVTAQVSTSSVLTASTVATASTVHTATTPSPAPSTDPRNTLTLQGFVRSDGEPVEGVEITITSETFDATVETDATGQWTVQVPDRTNYDVTIDPDTLPDGVALRDPDRTTVTVDESLWTVNSNTVSFPTGEDTRQVAGFGDLLAQRLVSGINFGLLIALAAIGITLIFGTTGLNNFAHGELVTFGGIMGWFFSVVLGLNIVLGILIAVILGAAFGYVQDAVIWKPLRKKGVKLVQAMIVSIGLALAVRYFYLFLIGGETKAMRVGLSDAVVIGSVRITTGSIVSMVVALVVLAGVAFFLTRTRIGKATRAVSDNPSLAAASGIDVDRIIRIVWVISGGLASLAGVMLGLYSQVTWDMGFQVLLLMFAAVTLGGLGSAYGALVGSIVVGLFVELSTLFMPADLKYAAALIVLILVLLVRPQGILGRRERIG